jgi:hypothetical protein
MVFGMDFLHFFFEIAFLNSPCPYRETPQNTLKRNAMEVYSRLVGSPELNQIYAKVRRFFLFEGPLKPLGPWPNNGRKSRQNPVRSLSHCALPCGQERRLKRATPPARSTAVVVVAVAIVGAGLSGSNAAEVVSVV